MTATHRPAETADFVRRSLGPGPHRVPDLLAAGLSRGQVRAAVAAGTLAQVRRGVVGLGQPPSLPAGDLPARVADARARHGVLARAALLTFASGTVVSHCSAGLLLCLPTTRPGRLPSRLSVTAPTGRRSRAAVRVYDGVVHPEDRITVDAVLCTSVARTALDVARGRPLAEALVVLDAAAARGGGGAALASAYSRLRGVHGLARLAGAVDLADPLSESPLESASRGVLIDAGLPAPELQAWIPTDDGRRHRVDFLWREQGVIGEADGWGKYAEIGDLREEKRREDSLRRAGFTVVRWTSDELWTRPRDVAARVRRAL